MFEFTPVAAPSSIFLIGAGGTGGRLLPLLAQFLKTVEWVKDPTIYLVDHDVIEERNLKRQNFIHIDVNKNKAVVLAERYEAAYGVRIVPIIDKITPENAATFWVTKIPEINNITTAPLVLMCVDTAEARRSILKSCARFNLRTNQWPFYIDGGNEDAFGQVMFFHPIAYTEHSESYIKQCVASVPELIPVAHKIRYTPMDVKFYMNLADKPGVGSCADLDQTLAINALVATTMMGVIQNYYYAKPFKFNRINISLNAGSVVENNTVRNFAGKTVAVDSMLLHELDRQQWGINYNTGLNTMVAALIATINQHNQSKGIELTKKSRAVEEKILT